MNTAELVRKLEALADGLGREAERTIYENDEWWYLRGQASGVRQAIKLIEDIEKGEKS